MTSQRPEYSPNDVIRGETHSFIRLDDGRYMTWWPIRTIVQTTNGGELPWYHKPDFEIGKEGGG